MPAQKPTNAGSQAMRPRSELSSMAGTMRLQIEAATMTPAANPVRTRVTMRLIWPRMRKTSAAPSVVPANGIARPQAVSVAGSSVMSIGGTSLWHAPGPGRGVCWGYHTPGAMLLDTANLMHTRDALLLPHWTRTEEAR